MLTQLPIQPPLRARLHRLAIAAAAVAATTGPAQAAEEVVVTGSVVEHAVADAPYAISVVDRDDLRAAGAQINLSEALARVPGLVVANRSNFAQDLQISSRGFGARAGFGVRGLRLLTDGIPATGPDGQGQVSQFDLGDAERIEVLRGPFSVLYGNSSGGVISLFTAPVKEARAEGELDGGSFGLKQLRGAVQTPIGENMDLRASASVMSIDGFRPHSGALRRMANLRWGWHDTRDQVTVIGGLFSQPADDPLGLTRQLFDTDPLQTAPQATQFDTRKESSQGQIGGIWKHRFDEGALRDLQWMAYTGHRSVTQWLAITAQTQAPAKHGGGVVEFGRDFAGSEFKLRWAWTDVDVQAGIAADEQRDGRKGYENYTGPAASPTYGVIGNLRRDETDRASSADAFAQGEWAFATDWTASAGLRSGRVKISSEDHYLSNGDDSGSVQYGYTNPVAGLRWQPVKGLNLHASIARGFESPTLNELAYRADGTGGLNFGLLPQTSRQAELGAKWRAGVVDADVALFQANVSNELGVATNAGGRSAYQNVGHTQRRGAELSAGWQVAPAWRSRVALTWLDATYQDNFLTCGPPPCNAPNLPVPAGNRIAGTQKSSGFAELAWAGGAYGDWGLELRGASNTAVNDLNSDFAGGYGVAALRFTYAWALSGGQRIELLARADNLFDRRYAGSVIVNEANSRYFETGVPRSYLVALRVVGGI